MIVENIKTLLGTYESLPFKNTLRDKVLALVESYLKTPLDLKLHLGLKSYSYITDNWF